MKFIKTIYKKEWFPVVIIFSLWFIFSFPFIFLNMVPFPSDYLASFFSPWSSYPELFTPVRNNSMPDIISQIYPWRYFSIESWKDFTVPLWNPYSFGGTPHLANYQSAALSPLNLGFLLFPFVDWWSFLIILQPLLAGLFTYIYAKSIKVSSTGSLISSISFMFCGFMTSWAGYGTLCYAVLFIPLSLFAVEKYFYTQRSRYLLLLSATIPLSFFSGHFQMSLYFLICVCAYVLYKCISSKKLFALLTLYSFILFGVLICAVQLLPSIELYLQSFRSTLFQKIEVIPWGYLVTILAPDFLGNPVTRNAWFGHYAEWNIYIGLLPLFFAIYSCFYYKKQYILFFLLASVASLLLAFQSPLLDFLVFSKIPVLSTSALSRVVVISSFFLALLAGFGFDYLSSDIEKRKIKKILIEFVAFGIVFVGLWGFIFSNQFLDFEKLQIAKSNLRLPSLIFFVFGISLLICYCFKKIGFKIFVVCVVLLISFDMLRFASKWVPFEPKNLVYPDIGVTNKLKEIAGYNRAFANFGAEGSVYYGVPVLEGYDAVYIRRFGQFIGSIDSKKLTDSARSGVDLPLASSNLLPVANFLGVKYFIHKVSDGQKGWEFPFWEYSPESIKLIYDDGKYQVLESANAYPRAFLVNKVITEKDPQKILDHMFNSQTDLLTTAIVEGDVSESNFSSGSAKIVSYAPNLVKIETNSHDKSFLVLTDVYYPGWNAYINGNISDMYRTDFAFRGLEVPKGENRIEFKYEPVSFRLGSYIAIIGFVGAVVVGYFLRSKSKL